jgi:hypothetical protein
MKRIYDLTQGRLGHREFSEVRGSDVVELHRMLHALGYWRPELESFPEPPDFEGDLESFRSDPEAVMAAVEEYRKESSEYEQEFGVYDAASVDAVDRFRKDHNLDHPGNPAGLVDHRLVEALRAAYYGRDASAEEASPTPTP